MFDLFRSLFRRFLEEPKVLPLLLCLVWLSASGAADASESAGQLEQRFQPEPEAKASPATIPVESGDGADIPQGAADIVFILNRIEVEGVNAFDIQELLPLYNEFIGEKISLDKIYVVAGKIGKKYTDGGYLLSRAVVPAQSIDNGVVKIQVIEGYIDQVVFEGIETKLPPIFAHYSRALTSSKPLQVNDLERYLLLANDLPGYSFKSVMSASESQFGAAVLRLTPKTKPYSGSLSVDNRGSEAAGPWQSLVELTAHNFLAEFGKTTVRYATVPTSPNELSYFQLSESRVLNGEGLKAEVSLTKTNSVPDSDELKPLEVESGSRSFAINFSYPYIRTRTQNLSVSGGVTYRQTETSELGAEPSKDALYAARVGLLWDSTDLFGGGGATITSFNIKQGLDIGNARVTSRASAEPNYTLLSILARRNQKLTDNLALGLQAGGQWSDANLPSAESPGLGGESTVRGFTPSEWSGDRSIYGSLELQYQPSLESLQNARFYTFYDVGRVSRNNTLPGEVAANSARSTGLGATVGFVEGLVLNVELTNPLTADRNGVDQDWQLQGRLSYQF